MEPEHLRFGGGASETLLHPLVAVWFFIAVILIFVFPRGRAITPFLLAVFTIPAGQVLVLGGVHFPVLRILIIAGLVRGALSKASSSARWFPGGFNALDRLVVLWSLSAAIIFSLQWMETQALVNRLGDLIDNLGGYMVLRFLIPDGDAIRRTIKVLAVICAIQGACMINEQISHLNVFGLLGGIPLEVAVRDGSIRSQGVLGNINAGVFGGVSIPLFVWWWTTRRSRVIACVGIAGATAMVFTSSASTSFMAYGAGIVGLCFWPLRKRMRAIRWGLVLTLVALHLVMKAPVWSLIARVDFTGSSSGWHRYYLVDCCIRHFSDWWLLGYKHYNDWGWDMFDLCNEYVFLALTGGLVTLALYLTVLSRTFGAIGTARKSVTGDRGQEWFLWCLGSTVLAHVVSGFGISYMAQLLLALFPVLACVSVATFEVRRAVVRSAEPTAPGLFTPACAVTATDLPLDETSEATWRGLQA